MKFSSVIGAAWHCDLANPLLPASGRIFKGYQEILNVRGQAHGVNFFSPRWNV
ncbi:hypothetical protein [Arthrobacter sp. A5]|uniref:hypothetical protein n=1 Tax=Arthrobacter sp. A5 TaxID=576926 RepID=UPI003DA90D82